MRGLALTCNYRSWAMGHESWDVEEFDSRQVLGEIGDVVCFADALSTLPLWQQYFFQFVRGASLKEIREVA